MLFTSPIPFEEALDSRKVKALLPTELSSGELAKIAPEIRERAMFSARNSNATALQGISDCIDSLLNPTTQMRDGKPVTVGLDPATARLQIKQLFGNLGYAPSPEDEDTIKDLSSDKRIDLVLKTNTEMAQGYGSWKQGQSVLDAFPCQELFRAESRKEPRNWLQRWQAAGGRLYGGRMIARKNAPIWMEISAFGLPYPPFDYNSGMWVRDISRRESLALGAIEVDAVVTPVDRGFNDDLKLPSSVRETSLVTALTDLGYKFVKGVLTF